MLVKRKPDTTIYEVEQFFRSTTSLINDTKGVCQCEKGSGRGHVHTSHDSQVVDLEDGDWVMPEPDEIHYYPIKPEIFDERYEKVEEQL
jgi:hypothetical protein